MSSDVRFIRVNGRIVPVRGKGSAPKGAGLSKRYGAKKERAKPAAQLGEVKGALLGAAVGALAYKKTFKGAIIGTAVGMSLGSLKFYKKKKGESNAQISKRISKKK